jgi:hypothetical protein
MPPLAASRNLQLNNMLLPIGREITHLRRQNIEAFTIVAVPTIRRVAVTELPYFAFLRFSTNTTILHPKGGELIH